jgi:choline dehydrogenase-like flavoprotein
VTLSRELDHRGQRRLPVHHRVSAGDRASIRRSMEVLGAEFARLELGAVDMGDAARIGDTACADGTHLMGLLRMAHTPRGGAVDPECRVHGTLNLYVAGSAVFPTAGAVGPTLTIVALACRPADRVAGERAGAA